MCKSIFTFKIVLAFLLTFVGVSQARYSNGSGTPEDPYKIGVVADWETLMNSPDDWDKHFILMADLDMQGVALSPIGNNSKRFTGVLDGNDHVIHNAVIEQPNSNYIGLFGYLGQNSQISSIHLENARISGQLYVGGLVGRNDQGTLTACFASGSVAGGYDYTGGLAGYSSGGSLTVCSATGTVNGWRYVGGLVGKNEAGTINDCYAAGSVKGTGSYVGGLVGDNANGRLLACSADKSVEGTGSYVGGLVGRNDQGILTTCFASGSVAGGFDYTGGLAGYSSGGSLTVCSATGTVNGWRYVGGLVGKNEAGTINDCYAAGSVKGTGSYVGGLVGNNANGRLLACSADKPVEGTGSYVGGLVGRNDQGILNSCSASGSVTGGFDYTGGLAGYSSGGSLTVCSATGTVNGWRYVGGLVGKNESSTIKDCYAAGSVKGTGSYVGGLVGENLSRTLRTSYATGWVEMTGLYTGGLVGSNGGDVNDCFWDIQTSGMNNMCGQQVNDGTGCDDSYGKTTDEMQDLNTFLAAGWDFLDEAENGIEETWTISEGIDYPMLCWQVFYRIAYAPYPADGANDVDPNVTLIWIPSVTAGCHDVYFGEDFNDVNDGLIETFRGCQTEPNFTVGLPDCPYPDGLTPWTTYYWRIDEVNDADPQSPWEGNVWRFKVPQKKAYNPYPANGDEEVDPNVILTWAAGFNAQSHTVYFSEDFNDVINRTDGVVLEPTFYDPCDSRLKSRTPYYWCVDEFDGSKTHWGDVWSFTVRPYTKTWRGQISASEDDGYASSSQLENRNADYLKVGLNSFAGPPYYMSGMVFQDVNVPRGAKIVSAQLKIKSHDERLTAEVFGTVQAEATDNASTFDSQYSIADRPRTNASIDWDHHEPWSPNTWCESPDISDVIQEAINRDGWLPGNSLAIFYCTREQKGGYRHFSSDDRGADSAPKLEITYEP